MIMLRKNFILFLDHDIISLPGLNLNLPCNQDSDGITWLSSINRPSYAWKRTDGIAIFGIAWHIFKAIRAWTSKKINWHIFI